MNKRRFDELLERNGIKTQVALLRKMSKFINDDNSIDSYDWAEKQKGNFNKMIKDERPFPQEYIIAMENVLRTSIAYLFDGEEISISNYRNAGIRYAASVGTRKAYNNLAKETDREGEPIIFGTDEYEKSLIDYIIEFQSIEGIRFLVENYGLRFNVINNMFSAKESSYIGITNYETAPYLIADLICKNDDAKTFNAIFDAFEIPFLVWDEDRVVFYKDKFLDIILKSDKVLLSLCNKKYLSNNAGNLDFVDDFVNKSRCYLNPILNKLLERAIETELYDKASLIMDYGKEFNEKQIDFLIENNCLKDGKVIVEENGYIRLGTARQGSMLIYKKTINPDIPQEIKVKIKAIQQQIEELKYLPEIKDNWKVNYKANIVGDVVYKKSSKNQIEYEMMEYMQNNNFIMVPKYIGTDIEENIDKFSYIEGKVSEYPRTIDNNTLTDVVKFLRDFHRISQKKLGYGKTYIHGDLNTKHLVFNEGKLTGVIDWELCYIGNVEDELIDLILEWTDISSYIRRNERVFETIKNVLEVYEADDEILKGFADKMKNRINTRIENLTKDISNYEYMYETLHHALTFVELYKDRLDSM